MAVPPAWAGDTVNYAGTIRAIDEPAHVIVVEDVGARMTGQPAPVTPRRIVLTPSTGIFLARRVSDPREGYPGEYRRMPAERSDLGKGDFVSVTCSWTGDTCRATEVTMVEPDHAG